MPTVPLIGHTTVCELNREFLTSKDDADKMAQDMYFKILGRVYPAFPFLSLEIANSLKVPTPCEYNDTSRNDNEMDIDGMRGALEENVSIGFLTKQAQALKQAAVGFINAFLPSKDVEALRKVKYFQGVSWHKHRQCLAILSGDDQVIVYDFEDPEFRDPLVLSSESQRQVAAVDWRPNAGMTLSVACRGGICIWTASYPGTIVPVRSSAVTFLSTPRGLGVRWALVDFLDCGGRPVTALSWNPFGRLLVSASCDYSEFVIWDVSQGTGTPLRRGFAGISLLKWSPSGDYLLSASLDKKFYLWETSGWTSEKWSSGGGSLVSATWNPEGSVLLTAFDQATTLGGLYFAGKPPSLDAHLVPHELPEVDSFTQGSGKIETMAWDGIGERLAVSYTGGDETFSGLVAIYATQKKPIVTLSLVGLIRGPGHGAKPISFAFYDQLKQGLLLAVCWSSGLCCTYPLLFK